MRLKRILTRTAGLCLVASCLLTPARKGSAAATDPLRLSVYATAGDVTHYLVASDRRPAVVDRLRSLRIDRVFLEGRRGDEYVAATDLGDVRDYLGAKGIHSSGGIATVPGSDFGVRQDSALGWLNWESQKTQTDIASFFRENAPVFSDLIVDDFYCTADMSAVSESARGNRSWGNYRRDLLVSLARPMMLDPARAVHPGVRLIVKFPQWYDRFHLFGYDPPRLAALFDQVWVGTEVRDPLTRRMGHVQPTEGYMNYRWLTSVCGDKTTGAWFDHIECSAQNFVDQAFLSVLAGARELTLFHLGDLMENHPGDALLAQRLAELLELARKVAASGNVGVPFYKPPGSDADDNLYLADYLGMIGLPILPVAAYPVDAPVAILPAQAAADAEVIAKARKHLSKGRTLIVTPAFLRRGGSAATALAGLRIAAASNPASATGIRVGTQEIPLPVPLEIDAGLERDTAGVLMEAKLGDRTVPFLTQQKTGKGRILVLNVRTFSEDDFKAVGEWLLAPLPRGLPEIPQSLADAIRKEILAPLRLGLVGPSRIALCSYARGRCLYSFRDEPVTVVLDRKQIKLPSHGWVWIDR